MSKNWLTVASLTVVLICAGHPITAQTRLKPSKLKIVKGYFCGETMGTAAGQKYLRTSNGIMQFGFGFTTRWGKPAQFYGFNKKKANNIGAEYIVRFVTYPNGDAEAKSFTFTGKVRKIEPCSTY